MPPLKKVRVEESILSCDSGSDYDDELETRSDVFVHYELMKGNLKRTDSRVRVGSSPRRRPLAFSQSSTSISTATSSATEAVGGTIISQSPSADQDVARTAGWLGLMDLNPSVWEEGEDGKASGDQGDAGAKKKKRKRTEADNPLLLFMEMADSYLDEMLRHEGLGESMDNPQCRGCQASLGSGGRTGVRCRDCQSDSLWCESCIVSTHKHLYLHRIERWNGSHFERTTLKSLGLRIQLGHPEGDECPNKLAAFDDNFIIIDSDGCHPVALDYCQCHSSSEPVQQLLRARLFPATTMDPRTAATFRVLDTFQMLSFTGKISAYEFLVAIMRRTDNTWDVVQGRGTDQDRHPDVTGKVPFVERHREFMRIVHEWRYLRMMKRFGRGQDRDGISNTKEGDCALRCPACPIPGVNMPKWENIPRKRRWLFALFLAIDANFRLRRKDVSNDERDPGLIDGFAYIVAEKPYKAFLAVAGKESQVEETTCSDYDAIKSANIRGGSGIAASGIGAVLCARHDFHRAVSAGDLQKGERYVNMDYIHLSGLRPPLPMIINISYDIGCQWERHLQERCDSEAYNFQLLKGDHGYELHFFVPKFHLPAHKGECLYTHSFNLRPGVGRTDGECPERGWSSSNRLAASTAEMGPGNRRDTVNDVWGDRNWQITVQTPFNLSVSAREAITEQEAHKQAFREFAGGCTLVQRETWSEKVRLWEEDVENDNPYKNPLIVTEPKDVKERLQKEDQNAQNEGAKGIVHRNMSLSSFILHGIEIQDSQRRHEENMNGLSAGAGMAERTRLVERGIALRAQIDGWIAVQAHFAPGTVALRQSSTGPSNESDKSELAPWSIPLCLPSDPGATMLYDHRAKRYEFEYRIAEAETALHALRSALIYDAHMKRSKEEHASGTVMVTRSIQIMRDVKKRIDAQVQKYRLTRARLVLLWDNLEGTEDMEKHEGWMDALEPLLDSDIEGPTSLDEEPLGEGFKILKWIWTVRGMGANVTEVAEAALRVEFCRSRARAHRWQEECLLLAEEMRRTERYYTSQAGEWEKRALAWEASVKVVPDPKLPKSQQRAISMSRVVAAGKVAHARRQASVWRLLHGKAVELHGNLVSKLQADTELIECAK